MREVYGIYCESKSLTINTSEYSKKYECRHMR